MKKSKEFLLFVVFLTVIILLINQLVVLVFMYKAYQKEKVYDLVSSSEKAIRMELMHRQNKMNIHLAPYDVSRNGEMIKQTIQTGDTTVLIEYDIYDLVTNDKILQYFFIKEIPIDLDRLNHFLQVCLKDRGCEVDGSYIEYYDLETNRLLKTNKTKKWAKASLISTDTIPLDIFKLVGVKAFASTSPRAFFRKMGYQLGISLILFLLASYCLVFLLCTIFRQRKLEKMRQDFVNAMVHEFKRPITNASMMLELAPAYLNRGEHAKAEAYILDCLTEFKKLTAYTDRIQRISNNEKAKVVLDKQPVPLMPFLERIRNEHSENRHKAVNISFTVESKREFLTVDALHFSNVLDNLVENAIKYSYDPVTIKIEVRDIQDCVELKVIDDGLGIPNGDKALIFDKFYRSIPKHGRKVVGFGLGLTYVKAIVEAHHGSIRVMDAPLKGSMFIIQIPT